MTTTSTLSTQAKGDSSEQMVHMKRFYVNEQTCKLFHGASSFGLEGKPKVGVELAIRHEVLREEDYEVELQLHVTSKIGERTVLTLDVKQAGLFTLKGYEGKALESLLNVICPSFLYPYACQVVSQLSMGSSLPPITLTPINFEALYQERQQGLQKTGSSEPTSVKKEDALH